MWARLGSLYSETVYGQVTVPKLLSKTNRRLAQLDSGVVHLSEDRANMKRQVRWSCAPSASQWPHPAHRERLELDEATRRGPAAQLALALYTQ